VDNKIHQSEGNNRSEGLKSQQICIILLESKKLKCFMRLRKYLVHECLPKTQIYRG
jgi:hypothetical protein